MSPAAIVDAAKTAGMDAIALTDHQSARNAPAIRECARLAGLSVLFGAEICTAEEVHTLALFDDISQTDELTTFIYNALPPRKNDPDTFGDQPVVTWDEEIIEMDEHLLAAPCRLTIPEVADFVHARGGVYIAAHVDRPNFSLFGSLGSIPEPIEMEYGRQTSAHFFDALELSRTADERIWGPRCEGYALIRSSDAHHLSDVARVWTEADGNVFSLATLKDALRRKATSLSGRLQFG